MWNNSFPWLGFIFWIGLFTWFGLGTWARYRAEQERQKTLRVFAERGTPLDKEMMEKLFPRATWQPGRDQTARVLTIGGIVGLFAGVGLLIGAQLIGRMEPDALYAMSTVGVMVICVGLGRLFWRR